MGEIDEDRTDQYLPLSLVRAELSKQFDIRDIPYKTGGAGPYTEIAETGGRLGFITPMTHNFCESCNRVRLTCTARSTCAWVRTMQRICALPCGHLRATNCWGKLSMLPYCASPRGHDFIIDRRNNRPAVSRHMSVTGG